MSAVQPRYPASAYVDKPAAAESCSFCGKQKEMVRSIFIWGPAPFPAICNECIDLCWDVLHGGIWRQGPHASEIEYQSWFERS